MEDFYAAPLDYQNPYSLVEAKRVCATYPAVLASTQQYNENLLLSWWIGNIKYIVGVNCYGARPQKWQDSGSHALQPYNMTHWSKFSQQEVFYVGARGFQGGYGYTRGQALLACTKYGALLATVQRVIDAKLDGAHWCAAGHTIDGPAWYPSQTASAGCEGGASGSPTDLRGASCYGVRPQIWRGVQNSSTSESPDLDIILSWNTRAWSFYEPQGEPWGASRRMHVCACGFADYRCPRLQVQKHLPQHNFLTVSSARQSWRFLPHQLQGVTCLAATIQWQMHLQMQPLAWRLELWQQCLERQQTRSLIKSQLVEKSWEPLLVRYL